MESNETKSCFADNGLYFFNESDGVVYFWDDRTEYAFPIFTFDADAYAPSKFNGVYKNGDRFLINYNNWLYIASPKEA